MTRRRAVALLAVLVALLGSLVWHEFELVSEITRLLPVSADRETAEVAAALAESPLSRTMILALRGAAPGAARQAAAQIAADLSARPEIAWIAVKPDERARDDAERLYFARRYHFLSTNPERDIPVMISEAGLAEAAAGLRDRLGTPLGDFIVQTAGADPFLAYQNILSRLSEVAVDGVSVVDGQYVSRDGSTALIFLATADSAFDVAPQRRLLDAIDISFAQARDKIAPGLLMDRSGVNRFAVASTTDALAEAAMITIGSILSILLVFHLVFRSPGLLLASIAVPIFAVLAATAATLVVFGAVHSLTLAVGGTLMGVCIDYPVHFFSHTCSGNTSTGAGDGPAAMRRLWPGLRLGALTTAAGFASLAWSSYPGLREIALFAVVGVCSAVLMSRVLLPALAFAGAPQAHRVGLAPSRIGAFLARASPARSMWAWLLVAAAVIASSGLLQTDWDDNVASLIKLDPALVAEENRIRDRVSLYEPGRFVVAVAHDEEAVLRANDRVAQQLGRLQRDGVLAGYRTLHDFVWSADLQTRNIETFRSDRGLPERVAAAFAAAGFSPQAFAEFRSWFEQQPAAPLSFAEFAGTELGRVLQSFRFDTPSGIGLITLVRGVRDPHALEAGLAGIDGVRYFDQSRFIDQAYGGYRVEALQLFAVGIALVVLLVLAVYRNLRTTVLACLPGLLAVAATLGCFAYAGQSLTLLHLAAAVLVFSMGVDYGVFAAETLRADIDPRATSAGIALACLFTVLSFGLLGIATTPAMRAIGRTACLGVLLSALLTPAVFALVARERPR